ncbi:MAG: hypothetical protein WBA23_06715 [Tunicatimonas sp.]|uniref:hypothetical protein n=1 Tax=Tunicatimonas sp. TaxID=1940096 RepID=UPI003C72CE61
MLRRAKNLTNYYLRYNPYFKQEVKKVLEQKEWDSNQLQHCQNEAFLSIFQQAVKRSSFYQKLYATYGVNIQSIKSVDDIGNLPIVTKKEVRKHLESIYIGNPWVKTKGHTSGTSGTPLVVYRDYRSTLKEGAYIWAQRALFGYQPGMKTVSLRGILDRRQMKQYDPHANCLYLSSFNLREENADWYCQQIQQLEPYAILAYPSSVEILANFFQSRGLTLNVPAIFTSSEQVYQHQREKIEKVFNTRIVDWYGNAERTIALEQRQDGQYYELPMYSVNEYEEDRTIATGLISTSFPLIRYQVDDTIVPCTDRSNYQVKAIVGRHDDLLLLPDGTKIGRMGAMFSNIDGLELAQIHQKCRKRFTINLVVNNHFSSQGLEEMKSRLCNLAGNQLQYDILYVQENDIVRTRVGKFKLVISEVA